MMRLGRRASLLVAFSLLASAATAYAEAAWVSNFLASDDGPRVDVRDVEDSIESEPIPLGSKDPRYSGYLGQVSQMIKARWAYPCMEDETTGRWRCEYKSARLVVIFGIAKDGRLAKVEVQKSSGYGIYDLYAVSAIESASPFPPVPPELMAQAKPGSAGVRIVAAFNYVVVERERIPTDAQSKAIPLDSIDPKYTDYLEQVRQRIKTTLESPCVLRGVACEYKETEVTVEFGIRKDGRVDFVKVLSPSPWPIYDEYSVRAIRLASPFPGVPNAISREAGLSVRTTIKHRTGRAHPQ